MPASRPRRTPPGSRPSDADLLRSVPLVQAVDDAERRADAAGALLLMASHPEGRAFWRPRRWYGVMQMSQFHEVLPGWATSRWILAQAAQHLGKRGHGPQRRRFLTALDVATELRGGPARLPGRDAADRYCRLIDHDWVFRQLYLYDLGGLLHFLDLIASADLVARADRIREWAAAAVGGYRLVGCDAATVTWEVLAGGERLTTANIGSAALLVPGECVIGRLVPIEDGTMFEGAPLAVPDAVAAAVARTPDDWVAALRAAPDGAAGLTDLWAPVRTGFLSDVPEPVWMRAVCTAGGTTTSAAGHPAGHPGGLWGGTRVAAAVLRLARATLEDTRPRRPDDVDPWCCVAAALLAPGVVPALGYASASLDPADRDLLTELAGVLAEPASSWCRALAAAPVDAA